MKQLLIAALFILSFNVHAQLEEKIAKASPHNASVLLGFGTGGIAFGLTYEHMFDQSAGIGGHLRVFPKDDDAPGISDGLTIIGASLSHHFYKRSWDLSFSPSLNIISIDSVRANSNDETTLGPGLTIALMTQITDMISIGFDNSRYWVWFNGEYAGLSIDDFALRVRASF